MESLREIYFKTDRIHSFDVRCWTFDVRCSSVSFSIRPAAFQASGAALMKLNCEQYFTATQSSQRLFKNLFSAFSACSAVNRYVCFLIRLAVFWPAAGLTSCVPDKMLSDKTLWGLNHRRPDAITFLERNNSKFEILCYQTNIPN
jgi:hypothetical protein